MSGPLAIALCCLGAVSCFRRFPCGVFEGEPVYLLPHRDSHHYLVLPGSEFLVAAMNNGLFGCVFEREPAYCLNQVRL